MYRFLGHIFGHTFDFKYVTSSLISILALLRPKKFFAKKDSVVYIYRYEKFKASEKGSWETKSR